MVAALAFGEQQDHKPAVPVAGGVQLGIQPAFGAADAAGPPFFCSRLADVRWALRWVASIMSRSGGPSSAARAAKMRVKTPSLLQRKYRLYRVFDGP